MAESDGRGWICATRVLIKRHHRARGGRLNRRKRSRETLLTRPWGGERAVRSTVVDSIRVCRASAAESRIRMYRLRIRCESRRRRLVTPHDCLPSQSRPTTSHALLITPHKARRTSIARYRCRCE